ncbi:reverse transcriptase family protein [Tenacibaculum sp. M341]|uniref:reverse transcriptase family protein n=1 Tax=Tenacibaculum sp. M341 TaxID=2530339 RepID=UPI001053E6E1|nr:reverse transcriptase family protein [Tenacibaculum sp. M341]
MSTSLHKIVEQINQSNHGNDYKEKLIEYSQNLSSNNLPIIFDAYHLAYSIGIEPYRLINLIRDRDDLYNTYKVRKKSGGYRWIMSPMEELKIVQTWIKVNILDKVNIHESANGFIKDRSIVTNANKHVKKETILNIDLYRFFDTISEKRVYHLFKKLGYTEKLSYDFSRLLCVNTPKKYWKEIKRENRLRKKVIRMKPSVLPQGAPTSPIISNLLCLKLDQVLYKYCEKSNLDYTRYADDITISGNKKSMPKLKKIKSIIRQNGFTVNINKIRFTSKHKKQTVTGLTVNDGVYVDKRIIKEINQELYYCIKYGYKSHLEFKFKDSKIKSNYKDWLYGKICFVYSVEKEKGQQLLKKFNMIDWNI